MKRFTKVLAILMVTALIMSIAAVSASAVTVTEYTPVAGTSTNFNKYLVVDSDANIPNKTFSFTVEQGTAIAAGNGTVAVIAGPVTTDGEGAVTSPSIADVTFAPANTTTAGTPTNDSDTTKKYATQQATVDFTGISFPEPGVYRYVIREDAVAAPYSIASTNPLTLDVYVTDDGTGTLVVSEYVLHTSTAAPVANANSGTADVSTDSEALADKTDGFTNEYATKDLGFSKRVEGNQASKDKFFAFTVNITGLTAGDTFVVDLDNAVASIAANPNSATTCINEAVTQPGTLTVAAGETSITQVYYLQDGQSIQILGLPSGAGYTVTEAAEDYTSTANNDIVAVPAVGNEGDPDYVAAQLYDDSSSGTLTADTYVGFTNTKQGVIPTGVLVMITPFAVGILLFGTLMFFMISKRRRENY